MRLLLDAHVLLWALAEPRKLGPELTDILENPDNDVLFSAVSLREIAIKAALKRPDFQINPVVVIDGALDAGFVEITVQSSAVIRLMALPHHHKDPFDRMLVAQALTHSAWLCTADRLLPPYTPLVRLIIPQP